MANLQAWVDGNILYAGSLNAAVWNSISLTHKSYVVNNILNGSFSVNAFDTANNMPVEPITNNTTRNYTFYDGISYATQVSSGTFLLTANPHNVQGAISGIRFGNDNFTNLFIPGSTGGEGSPIWSATGSLYDSMSGLSTSLWISGIGSVSNGFGSIIQANGIVKLYSSGQMLATGGAGWNVGSVYITGSNYSPFWYVIGSTVAAGGNGANGSVLRFEALSGTLITTLFHRLNANATERFLFRAYISGTGSPTQLLYEYITPDTETMSGAIAYGADSFKLTIAQSLGSTNSNPNAQQTTSLYMVKTGTAGSTSLMTLLPPATKIPPESLSTVQADVYGRWPFVGSVVYDASVDGGSTWTTNLQTGRINAITSTTGSAPLLVFRHYASGANAIQMIKQGIMGWAATFTP